MYIYVYAYLYTDVRVCVYIYICICISIHMYVAHLYMYTYIYIVHNNRMQQWNKMKFRVGLAKNHKLIDLSFTKKIRPPHISS